MRQILAALLFISTTFSAAAIDVNMTYLRVAQPRPPTLSNLDPIPENLGIAGASVALADNQTTGKFLGQSYTLEVIDLAQGDDALAAAKDALGASPYLVLDMAPEMMLAIADLAEAQGALLFNASSQDPGLREQECRANLFHTTASVDMRTDALAQFFVKRRWSDFAMITGTYPEDIAFAEAMKRSLAKFGLNTPTEKTWGFDADMRRNAAQEVPLFTQALGKYDALIIADTQDDFGRYIPFNTWQPRPVTGTEGLSPVIWAPVIEQWGAAQLQSRFTKAHMRDMRPRDYAAWAAIRAVGEAVIRTNSDDPATLRSFMLSPEFELAGFKGRPLTFRDWNGQLRQPIALTHSRAQVASAPLEGFLHQFNELDTLGTDRPNTNCTRFGE